MTSVVRLHRRTKTTCYIVNGKHPRLGYCCLGKSKRTRLMTNKVAVCEVKGGRRQEGSLCGGANEEVMMREWTRGVPPDQILTMSRPAVVWAWSLTSPSLQTVMLFIHLSCKASSTLHLVFGSGSSMCLTTFRHSRGTRLLSGGGVAVADSVVPVPYCERYVLYVGSVFFATRQGSSWNCIQ